MQIFYYFCAMKRRIQLLFVLLLLLFPSLGRAEERPFSSFQLEDIILDIYNAASELGEVDYEQLQTDLYALYENPIDLNHTSDEELSQLYFLSPHQIDEILLYAAKHPFESLYELQLIRSLADYEIRNLLPFVRLTKADGTDKTIMSAREVFAHAKHEVLARVDARKIEEYDGHDPMYAQLRYRFDYKRRVIFGGQLRRPAGGMAKDLQYGLYLQLTDVAPHLHKVVAGNFQASFGNGLVLAPVFRTGKSSYVTSAGQSTNGLRYYSSADGQGLHGAGATMRWDFNKATRLDVSALYSMNRYNDSTWRHVVGANLTMRHKRLELQLTAIENIFSDSIHPYRNAKYNRHYFRGRNQAVLGASVRYNYGWFDAFAEVAASQNKKWGVGVIAGSRFYPTAGVSLIALYRYYSPWFDNEQGYAFSETSRINDENGGYLGFDITRWKHWRLSGYGDVFYFSGYKYGLGNDTCSVGYDAMMEAHYSWTKHPSLQGWDGGMFSLRLRARKKGNVSTYAGRVLVEWGRGPWSIRTTADANLTSSNPSTLNSKLNYGVSLAQDVALDFSKLSTLNSKLPLSLRLRLQGFDAREWNNRIYLYEHDVLYAFSIPATYGLGGRAYMCIKWQIIKQLSLYLRVSETVYQRAWYIEKHPDSVFANHTSRIPTRTDIHLLLRATF